MVDPANSNDSLQLRFVGDSVEFFVPAVSFEAPQSELRDRSMASARAVAGKRGAITSLSCGSRRRATRVLNSWDVSGANLMLMTFTPSGREFRELVPDARAWYRASYKLRCWLRDLGLVGFYKIESQARGAPHLHCWLSVPASWSAADSEAVVARWKEILGSTHRDFRNGQDIRPWVGDSSQIKAYIASYVKKKANGSESYQNGASEFLGRRWGVVGELPQLPVTKIEVEAAQFARLKAWFREIWIASPYSASLRSKFEGDISVLSAPRHFFRWVDPAFFDLLASTYGVESGLSPP